MGGTSSPGFDLFVTVHASSSLSRKLKSRLDAPPIEAFSSLFVPLLPQLACWSIGSSVIDYCFDLRVVLFLRVFVDRY